jgi:hypothetical protein
VSTPPACTPTSEQRVLSCPVGQTGFFWQNDQNHRFSSWIDDFIDLVKNGCTYEGVAMCAAK